MHDERAVLGRLTEVIRQRKAQPSDRSYTAQLLAGGVERMGAKVTEEAAEVVEAAAEPGKDGQDHLVREVADLLYHVMVLLAYRDRTLADVEHELGRRFGTSGLDEKASRDQS